MPFKAAQVHIFRLKDAKIKLRGIAELGKNSVQFITKLYIV